MARRGVFNRRAFIRAVGAGAITLPFLRILDSQAQNIAPPKRLIVVYTPHGVVESNFWLGGSTQSIGVIPDGNSLKPLEPFKDKLLVLRGVDNKPALNLPSDPVQGKDVGGSNCTRSHGGSHSILTGRRVSTTSGADLFSTECEAGTPPGDSIDQVIADQLGIPAYHLGVQVSFDPNGGNGTFYRSGAKIAPQSNPLTAFADLFQNVVPSGDGQADRLILRRQSILSHVRDDMVALRDALGRADQHRLEAHLDAIATLESQLTGVVHTPLEACTTPNTSFSGNVMQDDLYAQVGELQTNLMVMALACDIKRVMAIQWGGNTFKWLKNYSAGDPYGLDVPLSSTAISALDTYKDHHEMSHSQAQDTNGSPEQAGLTAIKRWYSRQMVRLVEKLSAIPEGTGTMLDNTLILWCTEIRRGTHDNDSTPFTLIGNVGGHFSMGRQIVYATADNSLTGNGVPHNNLLVSICKAFGVTLPVVDGHENFGDARFCSGELPQLTA